MLKQTKVNYFKISVLFYEKSVLKGWKTNCFEKCVKKYFAGHILMTDCRLFQQSVLCFSFLATMKTAANRGQVAY